MILDWKIPAQKIYSELKNEIQQKNLKIKWVVVLVWNNINSLRYIKNKLKNAKEIWADLSVMHLDEKITTNELLKKIELLNEDIDVNWIIVQLPLPKHIDEKKVIYSIKPKKDIDGFHIQNLWKLVIWDDNWLWSCTPLWIIELFRYYNIDLVWKNIVIVWRSNIVWKPIANLLINKSATVTICNSKTKNIEFYTKNADIVITAMWCPWFLTLDKINNQTVVIDVWFSVINWKIYWDADFENIEKNWNMITPVPWWVWALTVAFLMKNLFYAFNNK